MRQVAKWHIKILHIYPDLNIHMTNMIISLKYTQADFLHNRVPKRVRNNYFISSLRGKIRDDNIGVTRGCFTSTRLQNHYGDVIMGPMASQISSLAIVYSTDYWGPDQRKHQSSAWLAFVRGIHRWPVNSSHKRTVTRKIFPLDDVIIRTPFCSILIVFTVSSGVTCGHNFFQCNDSHH